MHLAMGHHADAVAPRVLGRVQGFVGVSEQHIRAAGARFLLRDADTEAERYLLALTGNQT